MTILYTKNGNPIVDGYPEDYEEIEFDGKVYGVVGGEEIVAGDKYLARRNTGWKLLTCKEHINDARGYVIPVENAYCFDTHECFKIITERKA